MSTTYSVLKISITLLIVFGWFLVMGVMIQHIIENKA